MSNYNNIYDEMVKEAYEEILGGFDKEALDAADYKAYMTDPMSVDAKTRKHIAALIAKKEGNVAKHYVKDGSRLKAKYHTAPVEGLTAKDIKKSIADKNRTELAKGNAFRIAQMKQDAGDMWKSLPTWGKTTAVAAPLALAAAGGTYAALKRRKKNEEDAEKAAAYFEEAQLIKEAAENDYAVACAYEDAAYQILDELGLLED